MQRGPRLRGFEIKRTSAPTLTRSMRSAIDDLGLNRLDVIHAGDHTFPLRSTCTRSPERESWTISKRLDLLHVIGTIHRFRGSLDRGPVLDGVWANLQSESCSDVRVFFSRSRQASLQRWRDYAWTDDSDSDGMALACRRRPRRCAMSWWDPGSCPSSLDERQFR